MPAIRSRVDGLTNNLLGMGLAFLATFAAASVSGMVRHLSANVHPFEITFFGWFFGIFALLPWVLYYGLLSLRTDRFRLHIFRVFLSVGSSAAIFYALSVTPLAAVTALKFTVPIFTTLLAMFILNEQVGSAKWLAILFGFAGIFVIVRPGFVEADVGSLLVLVGALLAAFNVLVIKVLTRTDSVVAISFYGVLLGTPLALMPALFVWQWPDGHQLLWLAGVGIVGTLSGFAVTQALKLAETNVITPLFYLQLVWAAAIGYVFFAEVPSIFTWVGGTMIFSSMAYIAYRESKVRKAAKA
jgi:drug/metabolite transporter (DMT)-like permease